MNESDESGIEKTEPSRAIEKSRSALQYLKDTGWIENFGILPYNSQEDIAGFDAWVTYRYNGSKVGRFPLQILSKVSGASKHERKHFGVPHIVVRNSDNTKDAIARYTIFLFVHNSLNEKKSSGLKSGLSMLCPFKCRPVGERASRSEV